MNRRNHLLSTVLCAGSLAAQGPTDHAVVLEFFSAGPFGATTGIAVGSNPEPWSASRTVAMRLY